MPSRINGIGTAYIRRSNALERPGRCEGCGSETRLQSYDTRLWFTVLYIPLVPLGRKHVTDDCPACRRHRVISAGEWEKARRAAMEEAMRRAAAEPAGAEAQIDLHRTCLLVEEWEKADAFQIKLEEDFARDARVHLYLAQAHAYRGRPGEAERALRRARELDPSIAPAEPPRPALPAASRRPSRARAVLVGILAALVAVVFAVSSVRKASSRDLHVVSGFARPLTVEIEGVRTVTLGERGWNRLELPEGRYRARFRGAFEGEHAFEIDGNFFTRLFDGRTFVLNPGGAAILVVEEAAYAARTADATGAAPFRLHYGKPFDAIPGVDYPFQPFPESLRTKEKKLKKRRLNHIKEGAPAVIVALAENSRHDEALALAEWALLGPAPDRAEVLPLYLGLSRSRGCAERAEGILRELCAARPVDVEVHRIYQGFQAGPEKLPARVAEYDALLAAAPGDGALLYLRGRLEVRVSKAREFYERALQADPENGWAHNALGYGFAASGDWPASRRALESACAHQPANASFREALRRTRFALGDHAALERELRDECAKSPHHLSLHQDLVRVRVAKGDAPSAGALVHEYRDRLKRLSDPQAAGAIRELTASFLYATGDFEGLAKLEGAAPNEVPADRPVALLELGRTDEAEKAATEPDALFLLALSIARPGDAALREKAAEALAGHGAEEAAMARALRSGSEADLDEAADAAVAPSLKAAALAALAQRIPGRAAELRERAGRLNKFLFFPYHFLRRWLEAR